ncbi:hypothetical protein [Arthrobacter sp. ok362]|uniref:hypothetical protein n=1 Tax=Arthrobacter sp. ok362 TaxID=1761745 RepID=UPI00087F836B|nr:hypothetical protein [Arthrobacter sp. ok362]SDL53394.1 hypothetical protein SAMN04487913_110167 [Arthrobacter sp. ok362]
MKKIFAAVSLSTLAAVLVAGCAGSLKAETPAASTAAASSAAAAPVSQIPKPDAAQASSLRAELAKVNPLLDNDKAVDNSRNQCTSILGGSPADKLVTAAKTRFAGGQVKSVSDAEAQQIIEVIKANGFCKA